MADNLIKDFVKKQTSTVTIGVPKAKPQGEVEQPRIEVPAAEPKKASAAPAVVAAESAAVKSAPKHIGRPKSDIEKCKMSVYVPVEDKKKLVKIQHQTFRQNLNDILLEAINDILVKYGEK